VRRIAVFADVQNLYYTVRQAHGCHFNYAALWADISQRGQIVEAYAYAIDRGDSKQQQFQQILRNLGFIVKLKPYIQRSDGSAKGDWDVGITIDIMDVAPNVDEVVLASGDGDFDLLLERIISKHGVEAVAYGVPGPDRQLPDPRRQPLCADRRRVVAQELKDRGNRTRADVSSTAWSAVAISRSLTIFEIFRLLSSSPAGFKKIAAADLMKRQMITSV
jgi:uncharacterized LabA/DUF88 family protein